MMTKRELFIKKIKPKVNAIFDTCKKSGITSVLYFEFSDSETASFSWVIGDSPSDKFSVIQEVVEGDVLTIPVEIIADNTIDGSVSSH